jgi:hypothetical protein
MTGIRTMKRASGQYALIAGSGFRDFGADSATHAV